MAHTAEAGVRLVFQSIGPQAPLHGSFDVLPREVCWRDDQSRVRMVYDRASAVLRLHSGVSTDVEEPSMWVRLDAVGVAALSAQAQAASKMLDQQTRRGTPAEQALARRRMTEFLAPRGPWAALEKVMADDPRPPLPGVQYMRGYRCSRIALQANGQQVGEACVAEPQSDAGGVALVQMLGAMAAVLDQLRQADTAAALLGWPSHPLLPAARSCL